MPNACATCGQKRGMASLLSMAMPLLPKQHCQQKLERDSCLTLRWGQELVVAIGGQTGSNADLLKGWNSRAMPYPVFRNVPANGQRAQ